MKTLTFTVGGQAASQGSKRHVGGGRMIESSKALGPWRERVAIVAHTAVLDAGWELALGAIIMDIEFVLMRPKATPKRVTPPAIRQPDLDKCARAIGDALTGICYRDDSQIIELHLYKRLAELGDCAHTCITVSHAAAPVMARDFTTGREYRLPTVTEDILR